MLTGCDDVTSLGVNFCETRRKIWSGFSNRSEISQKGMKVSRLVYSEGENLAPLLDRRGWGFEKETIYMKFSICSLFWLQSNPKKLYMCKAHGNRIIILQGKGNILSLQKSLKPAPGLQDTYGIIYLVVWLCARFGNGHTFAS